MISASSLMRNCGYPRELMRIHPKSDALVKGAALGTLFHEAIPAWAESQEVPATADEEVNGWLDLLAATWWPPAGALFEAAFGVTTSGRYSEVQETSPHVYTAGGDPRNLLTAGRMDLAYVEAHVFQPSPFVVIEGDVSDPIPEGELVTVIRDWKTGKWPTTEASRNLQLAAAGFAMAEKWRTKWMRLEVYYVRDGVCDSAVLNLDSPEAAALWAELDAAARLDDKPNPGEHCGDCWERRKKRCQFAEQS